MENYFNPQTVSFKTIKISLVVLALFVGIFIYSKSTQVTPTITVVGTADTSTKADKVTFVITRINTSSDVALGIDDGINGINKLIKVVQESAGPNVEIKKTFYQITPQSNNYTIANAFSVSTDKTEEINNWIKKLYAAGATAVSNIVFESTNYNSADQNLKSEAINNAHQKAESTAKSMSKKLGKIISVSDESTNNSSTIESVNSDTNLINLSKSLSVTYQIK